MYKKLLLLAALILITACSSSYKKDDLQINAEDSYSNASTLIGKAKSYQLNVSDAENQLAQAAIQIKEEKYKSSIISSESAANLAADAISQYEQKQDTLTAAKVKATMLAKAEEERLAAEAKMQKSSTRYVVQAGDNLWNIAAASSLLDHNPLLWPIIYSDNQSVIADPDLITPDMLLIINRVTDSTRLNKAKRHAQARGNWRVGVQETSDQKYLPQ